MQREHVAFGVSWRFRTIMQSFRGAKQSTWVTTVVWFRDQEDLVLN